MTHWRPSYQTWDMMLRRVLLLILTSDLNLIPSRNSMAICDCLVRRNFGTISLHFFICYCMKLPKELPNRVFVFYCNNDFDCVKIKLCNFFPASGY